MTYRKAPPFLKKCYPQMNQSGVRQSFEKSKVLWKKNALIAFMALVLGLGPYSFLRLFDDQGSLRAPASVHVEEGREKILKWLQALFFNRQGLRGGP